MLLPLDMFDVEWTRQEVAAARKLENLYHKGQRKAWDGREVLRELVERHGGVQVEPKLRDALMKIFAVILWGELAAWKISADLALQLEPLGAKMAATAQVHDEARHFYVMHDYLELLGGEVPRYLGPRTRAVLDGTLQANTLTKKLMGMQLMIEPMALTVFQLVRERRFEPVLADLLELYERDEARHVALGVLHLPVLLKDMTLPEAIDLWGWEFREFWRQFSMMRELEDAFRTLGIDPVDVVRVGRQKQVRANQMLMDEIGYDIKIYEAFVRFFDAKAEWDFPSACRRNELGKRFRGAVQATLKGHGDVPEALTNVAA